MDEYLAKGKRGVTYTREENGKKVLIKKRNEESDVDTIKHEALFTRELNKVGIGPTFISYDPNENELKREYIEGIELRKWLPKAQAKQIMQMLLEILRQCRKMDKMLITKQELNHPWKDILITTRGPVLIDFERCRKTEVPKNVTQFCQFLTGSSLAEHLKPKGLVISQEMLTLAQQYKFALIKGGAEDVFTKMIEVFRDN